MNISEPNLTSTLCDTEQGVSKRKNEAKCIPTCPVRTCFYECNPESVKQCSFMLSGKFVNRFLRIHRIAMEKIYIIC